MPKIHDCIQGTSEWLNLRAGIPTASEFDKILTPSGKPSASAEKYLFALLAERIMGHPRIEVASMWMQRGHDLEQEAVDFYELTRELETVPIGFLTNDDGTVGASPDRLVGEAGLLEIKVPSEHIHVSYLLKKAVDQAYYPQVQGQLWISERAWVDILSFHPEMPPALIRVERDEEFIGLLAEAVGHFSVLLENYSRDLVGRGWIKAWPLPREIRVDMEAPEALSGAEDVLTTIPEPPIVWQRPPATSPAPEPIAAPMLGLSGTGDGMLEPDYSNDPPPPCPKCGGPTEFKKAGKFKKAQWPDGWKCAAEPSCKKRGIKGAWITAKEWHEQLQDRSTGSPVTSPSPSSGPPSIQEQGDRFTDRIVDTADDKKVSFEALEKYVRSGNAGSAEIEKRLRQIQDMQPKHLEAILAIMEYPGVVP